jgi:hypothetical protein
VLALPGSPLHDARVQICQACPFCEPSEGVISRVVGAVTGEPGTCGVCGCPVASRASVSCPLGRF